MKRTETYEEASTRCRDEAEDNWLHDQGLTPEDQRAAEKEAADWYENLNKEVF